MPNPEIDHVEVKGVTYDVAGSGGAVSSVNGQTGTVVLDADDVGALPDDYVAPVTSVNGMTGDVTVVAGVQSVNGETGDVTLDADDVGALPDDTVIPQGTVTSVQVQATSPVVSSSDTAQSTTLNTTISLANGYGDTKNPYGSKTANQVLAAPNGSNGTPSFRSLAKADLPTLTASDVGAMPDSYVAPVTSVNGQTGTVSLDADDVGALPDDTSIPSATSDLQNDSGFVSSQQTEKIFVQGTTPSTASDGDIWIDTATQSASGIAYLPLSAGDQHPLSGNLYIDTESGTEYKIVFDENGTEIGKIGMSSDGTMRFWRLDSGNAACGIQCNTSTLNLFASGSGYIVLRPNGVNNASTEIAIDSSGWMTGKGFHAGNSGNVDRIGDMFIYRKTDIVGGSMTAGTFKTIDTISDSNFRPNIDVGTGFAVGYNAGADTPLRYGKVKIKTDGSVQVSPNESLTACNWTVMCIWRNPYV